ncbi:MAG: hypothetical protein CMJ92_00975 [Planctomycetes bacterium]|nr:hypothetical protein [Planctomycetota bacterium]
MDQGVKGMKALPLWVGSLLLSTSFVISWWIWAQSAAGLSADAPLQLQIFKAVGLGLWMAAGWFWFARVPPRHAMWSILIGATLVRALLLTVDPLLSDDLWRYLWDGEVQRQGYSPYGVAPADEALDDVAASADWQGVRDRINHPQIPTVYPPAAQFAFRFFAFGADSWRCWMIMADLAVGVLLCRLLLRKGWDLRRSIFWCWHPLPILESAIGGHLHLLAVLLLAVALMYIEGRQRWQGAGFLSLATSTLLVPAGLMFHMLKKLGWQSGGIFFAGLAATTMFFIFEWHPNTADGWGSYAGSWYSGGLLLEPLGRLLGVNVYDAGDPWTRGIRSGLVGAWWFLAWAVRNLETWRATRILMLGFLLLTPTLHPWYALWLLLPTIISPSPGAFLLTLTVLLNYRVLDSWRGAGVWEFPPGTTAWVFTLPLLFLFVEAVQALRRGVSTPAKE